MDISLIHCYHAAGHHGRAEGYESHCSSTGSIMSAYTKSKSRWEDPRQQSSGDNLATQLSQEIQKIDVANIGIISSTVPSTCVVAL